MEEAIINENLLDYYLDVPRVNGFIRAYATIEVTNKDLILILINKNNETEKLDIEIPGFDVFTSYTIQDYSENDPHDESPELSAQKQI